MRPLRMMISLVLVLFLTGSAWGVMFNYDNLASWSGPNAISAYMSDAYGSQVSVRGAMAGPLFPGDPFGSDSYLFSTVQAGGPWFFPFSVDIGFDASHPIESVSFEGAIFGNNPGHDFRMWAYTDGGTSLVGVRTWDTFIDGAFFDSGLITFDVPVDRLVFSDNWIYDVALDNLSVAAWGGGAGVTVPVPASTQLGLVGLAFTGILVFVRRRLVQAFASVG